MCASLLSNLGTPSRGQLWQKSAPDSVCRFNFAVQTFFSHLQHLSFSNIPSCFPIFTGEEEKEEGEGEEEDQKEEEEDAHDDEKDSDEESDKYSDILGESESEDDDEIEKTDKQITQDKKIKTTQKKEMMEAAKKEIPYTFEGMTEYQYFEL